MRHKKVISLLLSVLMVLTLMPIQNIQAAEAISAELLAWYPLLEDVKDVSGNEQHGVTVGNITYTDGLTLPGGTDSNTNYVQLPDGLFDNKDDVTVSVWIKSNTGAGNYSALFFGTPANTGKVPENYWLFNPTNPSGYFKSVFTNSVNSGSPWTTEVGVVESSTTGYRGVWVHYTTVISSNSVTGYINGEKIGTASKTRKTSDFGTGLNAYIGRSNYLNDHTFAGSFKDLRIYGGVLSDNEVSSIYSESYKQLLLEEAKKELTLGDVSAVIDDLVLPTVGANGATISWISSDEDAISNTGVVTLKDKEQTVVLTAVISLDGLETTKEFTVRLVSANDVFKIFVDKLYVPYVITQEYELPSSVGLASVSWASSDTSVVDNDGTIIPPAEGMADVTLTATISYNGQQTTKEFPVNVIESAPSYIVGYTRSDKAISSGLVTAPVTNSMHLGYSENGTTYTALNNGTGVLFAKADFSTNIAGVTKCLTNPYIFRMQDGTFGVIASRINVSSSQDAKERSSILLFTSKDLIHFEEVGLISLNTTETVKNAICEFDAATQEYRIEWTASDGTKYYNTTKDFETISEPKIGSILPVDQVTTNILYAVPGNSIAVTKAEGNKIKNKLTKVTNTGVSNNIEINLEKGESLTFEDLSNMKVTAYYSDGSTAEKVVNWNQDEFNAIDFNKEGLYQVSGTVKQTVYPTNMIPKYADPNVLLYNGKYYFIATNENGQRQLDMRESDTILGLKDAPTTTIFMANSSGDMSGCIWAPELHVVNGRLCVFFAAGNPSAWNTVRARVMRLKEGGNPMNPSDWETPMRVQDKDGEYLFPEGITLDMTYFEHKGEHYAIWAQRVISGSGNGSSDLVIAKINPEEPWKLTTDPIIICKPDYGWDRQTSEVTEGPYVLKNDGKIFVTFSGSNVDKTYCIGLLTADEDSDLLDASSWVKNNYPILTHESVPGEYGPGHNSYTVDEDGNVVNIYHTIPASGGSRNTNARRVHWAADGTPVLDMTIDREILPQNRKVTATIRVGSSAFTVTPSFNIEALEGNRTLEATVNVKNNYSQEDSVLVIVALFDENGKMINFSYNSKKIGLGKTDNLKAGFKLPFDVTNHKVKVFVWEGTDLNDTTMQPLSNVYELQ